MRILLGEAAFSDAGRRILGEVGEVLEFGSYGRFVERLPEADVLVLGLDVDLQKPLLDRAENLRVIASRTSQLRHLDLVELERRAIEVLQIELDAPVLHETTSTAEETFALVLALVRNLPWAFDSIREGRWERARFGGHELRGKTLGLVGFGRLGRMVASYARAFDMGVLAYDPKIALGEPVAEGVRGVSLDELLRESDVVSVHCTYSDETHRLLGAEHFAAMKPGAYFVNTARGEIADEGALLAALEEGHLAGAALDTLAGELPDGAHLERNPLVEYARRRSNLLIVPHLGGATVEATERTQLHISERLAEYLRRER